MVRAVIIHNVYGIMRNRMVLNDIALVAKIRLFEKCAMALNKTYRF